jgi:hypothetical protein
VRRPAARCCCGRGIVSIGRAARSGRVPPSGVSAARRAPRFATVGWAQVPAVPWADATKEASLATAGKAGRIEADADLSPDIVRETCEWGSAQVAQSVGSPFRKAVIQILAYLLGMPMNIIRMSFR